MERHTFTARQVQAITGISRPVLADLIKRDLVTPSKHRASGRGDNNLFDVADLFGLRLVEFLRPKLLTNDLLRAAFTFWHTKRGKNVLDAAREGQAAGVIVFDDTGNVTVEDDLPVTKLVQRRRTAMLYVIEPNALAQQLFHDVAMFRMAGDHVEPNPSGRESRRRDGENRERRPRPQAQDAPGREDKKRARKRSRRKS